MNDQFKHLIAIYAIKNIMKIITTVKPVENGHLRSKRFFRSSGLQIKGGGLFDREFTKSLIIRDLNDVLKNPLKYVHLFLLYVLLSKKIPKIAMHDLQQRV